MAFPKESQILPAIVGPRSLLETAITKLAIFANTYHERGNLQGLDVLDGNIIDRGKDAAKGISALTRCFWRATFSGKAREQEEVRQRQIQREVVHALDIVKCHYRMIERFRHGTVEEKNLANLAMDVISRCNHIIQEAIAATCSWKARFVPFFSSGKGFDVAPELKQSSVVFPPFPSVENIFPEPMDREEDRIWRPIQGTLHSPLIFLFQDENLPLFKGAASNQMVDVFRMKAITLINQHSLPEPTLKETVQLVRKTPIQMIRERENPSIVSMSQVILPFPGEWIETKGSFQDDRKRSIHSLPIPESFRVWSKSTQSGYPHPRQFFWAFASPLLPDHPLRPHAVPRFYEFLRKKNAIAYSLLPKGSLIHRAKILLEMKERILEEKRETFLSKHRLITEAILWSSGTRTFAQEEWQVVDRFYSIVDQMPRPFQFLAKVQELMMEYYLHEPYQKLNGEWLEFDTSTLVNGTPHQKAAFASQLLTEEREYASQSLAHAIQETSDPNKKTVFEYIRFVGEKISLGAHPIIMQEMSEKIGFLPPLLTDFSRKLLTSAIKQTVQFGEELEAPWTGDPEKDRTLLEQILQSQIQRELAIFSVPTFRSVADPLRVITSELERYYRARFLRTL